MLTERDKTCLPTFVRSRLQGCFTRASFWSVNRYQKLSRFFLKLSKWVGIHTWNHIHKCT